MLKLRKWLLGVILTGLSLTPISAFAAAAMNEVGVQQAVHLADSRSASPEHRHCHEQTAEHSEQAPLCCKASQCDCHQACAIPAGVGPAPVSYPLASVATRISAGLPAVSPGPFFRPPIA